MLLQVFSASETSQSEERIKINKIIKQNDCNLFVIYICSTPVFDLIKVLNQTPKRRHFNISKDFMKQNYPKCILYELFSCIFL